MQKNAIFIFQKIDFLNYTFHTRIDNNFNFQFLTFNFQFQFLILSFQFTIFNLQFLIYSF